MAKQNITKADLLALQRSLGDALAAADTKSPRHRAMPEVTRALNKANQSFYVDTWIVGNIRGALALVNQALGE